MIFLPRTSEPADLPGLPVPVEPARGNETILVVEDQYELRKLALKILAHNGYHLLEAANGAQALEVAAQHPLPIDLLLTDVVMPGMTGRESRAAVSSNCARNENPVHVRLPGGFHWAAGVLEPGVAYLHKPFSPVELSLKVRDVLGKPEPATILVIDDDEAVRRALAQMLERSEYHVLMAANGVEGCRIVDENTVHLVITDLVMPEREGLETVRYLPEEPRRDSGACDFGRV